MGSRLLKQFWDALLLASLVPAVIVLGSKVSTNATAKIVGLVYQAVHPTAGRSTAPFDTAIPAKERDKMPG